MLNPPGPNVAQTTGIEHEVISNTDEKAEHLPRVLGVGSTAALVVGATIGAGIFSVPAIVAAELPPRMAILCWITGGLFTLCGALSVAELAAALPQSGGPFAYLLEAYGPLPAFLVGWVALTVSIGASLGAVATIFADYAATFVPMNATEIHAVAALLILMVGAINYAGTGRAAAVMNVATIAKLIVVVALGALAFSAIHGTAPGSPGHPLPVVSISSFTVALIPILWAYTGWVDPTLIGGEVKRPHRTFPMALSLGIGCVIAVYLLVNLGFYHALPSSTIAHSPRVAAAVAARIPLFHGAGASIVAGIVLLSTFSALNVVMMTGPRMLYAMADRGLLFPSVGRLSPRFRTPSVAILLATCLGCAYVLENNFIQLADLYVAGSWPLAMLTVAAVFVLRRTRPDLPRPYRTWGYPVVPAIFLLASAGMLGDALFTHPLHTAFDFLVILSGIPVYYLWRWLAR